MEIKEILEYAHIRDVRKITVLFHDEDVLFADLDGDLYLIDFCIPYRISSRHYEPCTYIHRPDGTTATIHNAFDISEFYELAESGGTLTSQCGHEYDLKGICRLLMFAGKLPDESFDIVYLEGRMFIDILARHDAVTEDKALDLNLYGLRNHNIMNEFIHAKRIKRTDDGRYCIVRGY
ncbi:MAG: hypothetical protein IJJ00_02720 [Erysipelotrichaceae bacterium]|nr:hypothetical protein [Erysipelotrichaceae bacterium]